MQVSMLLCDYATLNLDHTVSLIRGGIDKVVRKIGDPLIFSGSLLIHIRADLDDIGKEFGSSISTVNEDGEGLGPPICGTFSFPPGRGEEKTGRVIAHNIVIQFGVNFPKAGRYEIRFRVDGVQKAIWTLEIGHEKAQSSGTFEPVQPWRPT